MQVALVPAPAANEHQSRGCKDEQGEEEDAQLCLGQPHDALLQALVAVLALPPQHVERLDVEVPLSPVVTRGEGEVVRSCGGRGEVGRERVAGEAVGEDEDREAAAQELDGGREADASSTDDCRDQSPVSELP